MADLGKKYFIKRHRFFPIQLRKNDWLGWSDRRKTEQRSCVIISIIINITINIIICNCHHWSSPLSASPISFLCIPINIIIIANLFYWSILNNNQLIDILRFEKPWQTMTWQRLLNNNTSSSRTGFYRKLPIIFQTKSIKIFLFDIILHRPRPPRETAAWWVEYVCRWVSTILSRWSLWSCSDDDDHDHDHPERQKWHMVRCSHSGKEWIVTIITMITMII